MSNIVFRIVAIVFVLMGLLWIGQGLGYVAWPQQSFMIDQRPWAWRGLALAVVGIVLLILTLRRPRT